MSIVSPYSKIVVMTGNLTITADTILVRHKGGGADTLTLPLIADCNDEDKYLVNLSDGGGTVTVVAHAGDAIEGRITALVSTSLTLRHDGYKTWFGF